MSDFDKEAEREKLREKYERDKEERKATQRMSDLLLKGATMTNAHCGTCGDPLFQQNGTTFCPSCHGNPDAVEGTDLEARPVEGEEGTTDDGGAATDTGGTDTVDATTADAADSDTGPSSAEADANADAVPTTRPDDQRGQDSRPDTTASTADTQSRSTPSAARSGQSPPSDSGGSPSERDRSPASSDDPSRSGASRRAATSPTPVDGDLEVARDALVRALEKYAEKAAATDDPRYAKDCLEAAREAGETLSTLR